MTVWTSFLWKMNIHIAKKWPEVVVTRSFMRDIHFETVFMTWIQLNLYHLETFNLKKLNAHKYINSKVTPITLRYQLLFVYRKENSLVYVTKVKNILTNCEKKPKAICIVRDYMLSLESIWGLTFRLHNHGRIFYINKKLRSLFLRIRVLRKNILNTSVQYGTTCITGGQKECTVSSTRVTLILGYFS